MSVSTDQTFEDMLEEAHLLYMRREYDRARMLLTALNVRYPGNVDVEDLLARVVLAQDRSRPRLRWRRLTWKEVLTRDFPPRLAHAALTGLFCLVEAGIFGVPALQTGFARGFSTWMVERHKGFPYMQAWQEFVVGIGFLVLGCALLFAFYCCVFYDKGVCSNPEVAPRL